MRLLAGSIVNFGPKRIARIKMQNSGYPGILSAQARSACDKAKDSGRMLFAFYCRNRTSVRGR